MDQLRIVGGVELRSSAHWRTDRKPAVWVSVIGLGT
jgi:hypothetical protein